MNSRRYIFFFVLIFISVSSYAQKNKKAQQEVVIIGGKILTSEDSSRVEQLFYSGLTEKVVQNETLAIEYFNQLLQIDPANPNALYELAQIYFKKGDLAKARDYAQKAVTVKTDNEWYWLLMANIYRQQQDYTLLNYALNELIQLAPDKLDYSFEKANALFMMGDTDESLKIYDDLEAKLGLTDQVLQGRQRIYLKKGNINKASADLEQLIKNNPSEVRYYLFLGDLYYSNHMLADALNTYEKAKSLDGSNPFTRLAIAQILEGQSKPGEAFEELKMAFKQPGMDIDQKVKIIIKYFDAFPDAQAIHYAEELSKILTEVHADDPKSFSLYGDVLYQKNELPAAEAAYKKALSFNKSIYAVWDQLIRIQLALNETAEVLKNGEETLTLFPNQYALYFYTSLAYLQNKQYDQAISYLNNALGFDIENQTIKAQIYSSLGDAYQEQKKYKLSSEAYENSLKIQPDNTYTLNNYAYYLSLRDEDLEKAERMSAKSNKLEPNNAAFQDTYAWVMFKLKNYEEAKTWMLKAISNNTESAGQFDHLGDIYFKLGDLEHAIQNWRKASAIDPSNSLIQKKINEKKYFE